MMARVMEAFTKMLGKLGGGNVIDEGMDVDFGTTDATIVNEQHVFQYGENNVHSPENPSIVCQDREDNIVNHVENTPIASREHTRLSDHDVSKKEEDLADSFRRLGC